MSKLHWQWVENEYSMHCMLDEETDGDNYLIRGGFRSNLWGSDTIYCTMSLSLPCSMILHASFPPQWREAQRSWPDLSHQWPAPGPDSHPPAGHRHPAERFREGAAHGGKRTDTSAGQSCGVPHAFCCQYTVSQLQRGTNTFLTLMSWMKTCTCTPTR